MASKEPNGSVEDQPRHDVHHGDKSDKESLDRVERMSTASKRCQILKTRKKSAKTRLTKARNRLVDSLKSSEIGFLASKTNIRRLINKINSEVSIIEKVIIAMKEAIALEDDEQVNDVIENLDKEFDEIAEQVDQSIKVANDHLKERLMNGEKESEVLCDEDDISVKSSSKMSSHSSVVARRQQNALESEERLKRFEEEQHKLEEDLQRYQAKVQLGKQRIEDARRVAVLNKQRAKQVSDVESVHLNPEENLIDNRSSAAFPSRLQAVKLKGVELPVFSGEDKTEYEPWKAAFMSVVDAANITVKEKMLRLQGCVSGKALKMVRDLGFSDNAYRRALEKLEKKFGGERRLTIKLLTTLRNWPKLRRRNLEDMEDFVTVLDKILVAVQDNVELKSQHLNLTAKEKLPEEDIQSYKYWLSEHAEEDRFEALVEWIELKVRIMDEAREETGEFKRRDTRLDDRRHNRGFNTSKKPRRCVVEKCQEDHPPWVCKMFKSLPVPKRKELIAKSGRCFRCLAAGHLSKDCSRNFSCGIQGCTSFTHSRYLHECHRPPTDNHDKQSLNDNQNSSDNQNSTNDPQDGPTLPVSDNTNVKKRSFTTSQMEKVSLMVLPALISNKNRDLQVNVMLDPCSTGSYVTENAAEELKLQGRSQRLTISGTGGVEVQKASRRVHLTVSNTEKDFSATVEANVLDNITGTTPAIQWSELKRNWPHLETIPFQRVANRRQIDLLIGSDHPLFHHVLEEIHGSQASDPIARRTNLGWVCFGPTSTISLHNNSRTHVTRTYRSTNTGIKDGESTNEILRRFWELESMGIKDENIQPLTPDEATATKLVETTLRLKDQRYEIGIPWKDNEPKFTSNYDMAFSRLQSLEKSLLKKKPEVRSSYNKIVEEYVEKGYVRKVPLTQEDQFFLPHFPVIRDEKVTTKVRVVFDAAARHNGKCLNDAIHPGPKLQRELVDVLTRFRRAPVALSADISQMFLQVGLRDEDRRYHRFLWRDMDEKRQPEVYEFLRLPFGNTASPFCAQHVLQTHAKAHSEEKPNVADTVDNSMYVDDVLDSCETTDEACTLRRDLSEVMSGAGFKLRKWLSNDPSVIADVPAEDRLPGVEIGEKENLPIQKTLGVTWNAETDTFTFQVKPPTILQPTKRSVLSCIASLFDPLQFLSPFTIRAKLLMQEIWAAGLDWDDVLPANLQAKWQAWISELQELSSVSIPRCLRVANPTSIQLHMFSDASKDAYAVAAYLVCRYNNDAPTSRLIAAKSRVSPVKAMTIPRLELMGAVLSARLAKNLLRILTVDKVIFWTDSTNVLYWIRNQSRNFKPFVANRIGEIHRSTDPEQWRHIPGEINPADLPTRGILACQLSQSKLWMEGPEILKCEESSWPEKLPGCPINEEEKCEQRKKNLTFATGESTSNVNERLRPESFSSLSRLVHVTAWTKRFITNCRLSNEQRRRSKVLESSEITEAETFWIRRAQTEAFPDSEKERCLIRFTPQQDNNGLLRVNGRLRYANDLAYDVKHPILLPKDHPLTRLIIANRHEKLGHNSGVEHLLTEIRSRFWVVKGRRTVRNFIEQCRECRKIKAKPTGQMMSPLPKSRLELPLRAFARIGTDYCGPFYTKQGRCKSRAKRYICLFTCLATRAVHLEMTYSLDTDAFLNAFTRMVSRRGTPSYVVSDNGTNFVAAEKELRQLVQTLDKEKIISATSTDRPIQWKFNPPSAPHFGGVFEAMVKSAKKSLTAILGNAEITDEELHTAVCAVEGLLNSRPITYVSSDPDDMTPLTPNHFIIGQLGGQFAPEAVNQEEHTQPKKRWRRIQQLIGQFWKRWIKEFLPSLNVRKKWFQAKRNLRPGDVVLVVEPNAKRGEWPLGRIQEALPGADGLVRVVKVKVGKKLYERPVHRLCLLEYNDEEN